MSGSVLTNTAGERGIRNTRKLFRPKSCRSLTGRNSLARCQEPRCHRTPFRCFPSGVLSLWPWHKLECRRGLTITDSQHPGDGMTTFARQLLPANDIPVP